MRLTLLRHGQTPSNVAGALDTAPPGPGLTELGFLQAAAAARVLDDQRPAGIFASNQLRAQQTAAPLAQAQSLEVGILPGLREIGAGHLEMATDADSIHRYIGTLISWMTGDLDQRIPGGPDGTEFLARYDEAIEQVVEHVSADTGPGGTAVVVSHGAAIRTWVGRRAINAAEVMMAPKEPAAIARSQYRLAAVTAKGTRYRHLDNTGAVTVERDAAGRWRVLDWSEAAVGGPVFDEPRQSGPTR